jgi:hypothetical protein
MTSEFEMMGFATAIEDLLEPKEEARESEMTMPAVDVSKSI